MNDVQKSNGFNEFYALYPRKVGHLRAATAYERAIKKHVDHETLMEGLRRYVAHIEQNPREQKYIKHPSTWLNGGHWADKLEVQGEMSDMERAARDVWWKERYDRDPQLVPVAVQKIIGLGPYAKTGAE